MPADADALPVPRHLQRDADVPGEPDAEADCGGVVEPGRGVPAGDVGEGEGQTMTDEEAKADRWAGRWPGSGGASVRRAGRRLMADPDPGVAAAARVIRDMLDERQGAVIGQDFCEDIAHQALIAADEAMARALADVTADLGSALRDFERTYLTASHNPARPDA